MTLSHKPSELEEYIVSKFVEMGLITQAQIEEARSARNDRYQSYGRMNEVFSRGYYVGWDDAFAFRMCILGLTKAFTRPDLPIIQIADYGQHFIDALDLANVNVNFMKTGNCKASSTYLKIPIAVCRNWIRLRTKEDVDKWFETLKAELPYYHAQCKALSEIKKKIKTEGAEFKAIMKEHSKSSPAWKEARQSYEEMILKFMNKLTRREEIMAQDRHCDFAV